MNKNKNKESYTKENYKIRYEYNKLVRDKIPEEINSCKGRKCKYRILNEEEYIKELDKKLLEEAHEFIEEHKPEELGDLIEVIYYIMKVKNISKEQVEHLRKEKSNKKGGFEEKIFLEYVEENKRNLKEEEELKKKWRRNEKSI